MDEQPIPQWFTDMQAEQSRGLVVGARVRVRLSECQYHQTHTSSRYDGRSYVFDQWISSHQTDENGRCGRVCYVNPTRHPALRGHWFSVALDTPIKSAVARGETQYSLDYAAAELELIDP